jgi:transcriptional regulator with XRE-family HTH domain
MAKRLGVSHATYTRMENGDQNVTLRVLAKLCRTFDCDMGALFRGEVRIHRRVARRPSLWEVDPVRAK